MLFIFCSIFHIFFHFLNISFACYITDVPDAPNKPKITSFDKTEMTLTWSAPDFDGGSPITNYVLEKKEPFSSRWSEVTKTSSLEYKVTGLKEGSEYQFRVSAENKAGVGKPSEPTESKVAKLPYGKSTDTCNNNIACEISQAGPNFIKYIIIQTWHRKILLSRNQPKFHEVDIVTTGAKLILCLANKIS